MKIRRIVSTSLSLMLITLQLLMPISRIVAYGADEASSLAPVPSAPQAEEPLGVPPPPVAPPDATTPVLTSVNAVTAFGVGNDNYGQQQRDTDNPQNHPGHHFAGPVNLINGNFFLTVGDFFMPARGLSLQLARSYNSLAAANMELGAFGYGWTHSYETHIRASITTDLIVVESDGAHHVYEDIGLCPDGSGDTCYASPDGLYRELRDMAGGNYMLTYKNGTRQIFNDDGKLIEIVDRYKNEVLLYYYDLIPSIKCPEPGPLGMLCRVDDPTGRRALRFFYDESLGYPLIVGVSEWFEESAEPGRTFTYEYDSSGNLIDVFYPEESAVADQPNYTYADPVSHLMTSYNDLRQPAGTRQAEDIAYDLINRATTVTYYTGSVSEVFFSVDYTPPITEFLSHEDQDPIGAVEFTDGEGQLSRVEYDANGNITYEGDYFYDYGWWWGKWWWWHPVYWWLLSSKVDANLNETVYEYDDWGNTTLVTTAMETQQHYLWEPPYYESVYSGDIAYGNLISATNSAGVTTEYRYDYAGNTLTEIQNADGAEPAENVYVMDDQGQLMLQLDPLGRPTEYGYDEFGNTTVITDAAGNATRNLYDDIGRPVVVIDQIGMPSIYDYDDADRLLSVTDAEGGTTQYTYGPNGRDNVVGLLNANGVTTTYSYDPLDRLVSQSNSLGQTTGYEYDNANRLVSRTDADGRVTQYTYDAKSRMREAVYYEAGALEPYQTNLYSYDGAGNLVWMANENVRMAYDYDAIDQRTSVAMWTPAWGMTQTLDLVRHPDTGDLAQVVSPDGAYDVGYDYDAFNRVQSVLEASGSAPSLTTYEYDPAGRLVSQSYPAASSTSAMYDYDATNHLTYAGYTGPDGTEWVTYTYGYDERGYTTYELDDGDAYNYTYDALGRVITATGGTLGDVGYTYDPVGNRLSASNMETTTEFVYDAHDRLLSAGDATFAYNEMGARTSMERSSATAMNASMTGETMDMSLTTSGGSINGVMAPSQAIYVYDNDMRLVRFQDTDLAVLYFYDPLGNLIGYTGSDGNTYYYLANGDDIYLELDATGAVVAYYVHGPQGVVSMMRYGVHYMFLYDGRGRVRWVVDPFTGAILHRYGPDLFDWGTGLIDFYNPIRIRGGWWFPHVQLILFGGGVFWDPWFGGFLVRAWPWLYWPFGPFHPWRPIFRFWPWPWPWPRPWGWPWPYPWPFLWPWPGAWVRPWLIWPIWPWGLRFSWPWWYWRWWWGWHWWGHWWCWHPWHWWAKWWWYPWWHPWHWWGYWWWPWWWWSTCWWWPWHWLWWIWWWPWNWFWGPGRFWWCWWWWWPWPWWYWPWMWPPSIGPPPDMGDAPDPLYPSRVFRHGAVHGIWWYEWLGPWRDGEWDSDQIDADWYDDGVSLDPIAGTLTFVPTVYDPSWPLRYGSTKPLNVHGWMDWNSDGDWDDADEMIVNWSGYPGDGIWPLGQSNLDVTQPFSVPDAAFGAGDVVDLWARFRLDYAANWESPRDFTRFGEVEDHVLTVARPHRPSWDGGTLPVTATPVITYAVVVTGVQVSISPTLPITPVWTTRTLHSPAAPDAAGDMLTIEHEPFTPGMTYTLSLSAGKTQPGGDPVLPMDLSFGVEMDACVPVTQVMVSLTEPGPYYTGTPVMLRVDMVPVNVTPPISYQVVVDVQPGAVLTSATAPFTLTYTFPTTGTRNVTVYVWNCDMDSLDAVGDTVSFSVQERPVGPVRVTAVDVSLLTGGTLYTDTLADFSFDFVPDGAELPISYTVMVDGLSIGGVLTATLDPQPWSHTFATTGWHTVTVSAWNADMVQAEAVSDEVSLLVVPYGTCVPIDDVSVTRITTGAIYTDTVVDFSAIISPMQATYPYTYTLDAGAEMTAVQNTVSFTRTYAVTGTQTVVFAAWNCAMTDPVTDSITFEVLPRPAPGDYVIFLPLVLRNSSSSP